MTERKIASWTEHPYTGIKHRSDAVHHRVMLFVYDHGVDVEHQVKGDSNAPVPSEWTPVDVWEVRGRRIQKIDRNSVLRE